MVECLPDLDAPSSRNKSTLSAVAAWDRCVASLRSTRRALRSLANDADVCRIGMFARRAHGGTSLDGTNVLWK
eukprot:8972470-Heterocapsa_arctica.AAC.1